MTDNHLPLERSGPLRILLVLRRRRDSDRIRNRLKADHNEVKVVTTESLGASLRALDEGRYDALVVDHDLPDGTSFDLLGRIDGIDPGVPIIVLIDSGGEEVAIGVIKAGAADYVRRIDGAAYETEVSFKLKQALHRYQMLENVQERSQQQYRMQFIETVRATVANVKHEVNNPLSIVSGNAQLLLELARMEGLGEEFLEPLRDIDEACERIASSLDKLASLKDVIAHRYQERDTAHDATSET